MNVSKGLSTWVGYLTAAAAAIAPIVGQLADDLSPLGVPAQTWIVVSAVLAGITTIGRMWQAARAAGAPVVNAAPAREVPSLPEPDGEQ